MGGNAFTKAPNALVTPRMPEWVYVRVKERCARKLKKLFDFVEVPIQGTDKKDYGDVDILVCGSKNLGQSRDELFESISKAIGAIRILKESVLMHAAIPWPPKYYDFGEDDWHIQIDVNICPTVEAMKWHLFKEAHGDLWNIVGSIIRPYGLTIDDKALWVRVSQMEDASFKGSKVFLTSNPTHILEFLSLPVEEYWRGPFQSFNALSEYIACCPMFRVYPVEEGEVDYFMGPKDEETIDREFRASDRRRFRTRPMFARWYHEFWAECRRNGRFLEPRTTREQVTAEALETFGATERYNTLQHGFVLQQQQAWILHNVIRPCMPQPAADADRNAKQYRSVLIKALRRVIIHDNFPGFARPSSLLNDEGLFHIHNVHDFVKENMDEIGMMAWDRQQEAYKEKLAKNLREKLTKDLREKLAEEVEMVTTLRAILASKPQEEEQEQEMADADSEMTMDFE